MSTTSTELPVVMQIEAAADTRPVVLPAVAAGVQLRLMGMDPQAVARVAKALAETGLVAITGTAPLRGGPGVRVYGHAFNAD